MADINDLTKCIKDVAEADFDLSINLEQLQSEIMDAITATGSAFMQRFMVSVVGLGEELQGQLDAFLEGIPSLAGFGEEIINRAKEEFWNITAESVCGVTSLVMELNLTSLTTGLPKLIDHGTVALNESLGNINPISEIKDIINLDEETSEIEEIYT